jgi:hypothetical protein
MTSNEEDYALSYAQYALELTEEFVRKYCMHLVVRDTSYPLNIVQIALDNLRYVNENRRNTETP